MSRETVILPPVAVIQRTLIKEGYDFGTAVTIAGIIDDKLAEFLEEHEVAIIQTEENLTFCEFNMK